MTTGLNCSQMWRSKLFRSKQIYHLEIWRHSKSEMLFELMGKCRIQIPLGILLILDQKISKIEPETAELALFGGTIKKEHRSSIFNSFSFHF